MADRIALLQPQVGSQGFRRTLKAFGGTFSLLAADLVAANTVQLFDLPAGFVPLGLVFIPSDMDSNGSPTLTLSLGDTGSAARYLSANTGGQTGTASATIVAAAAGVKLTAASRVQLTVAASSATAVAGTVTVWLWGAMDD